MKKALLLLIILGVLAVVASPVASAWDDQNYKFTTYNNIGVGKEGVTWNTKSGVIRLNDLKETKLNDTTKAKTYYLFIYNGTVSVNTQFPNRSGG